MSPDELDNDHGVGAVHMAWEFETDPAFQLEIDWIDKFVREEVRAMALYGESLGGESA